VYAVPADRAAHLKKAQVAEAAIRGPQVFEEMLEEMKKVRVALERMAAKEV
jgi:hypothetical protein